MEEMNMKKRDEEISYLFIIFLVSIR